MSISNTFDSRASVSVGAAFVVVSSVLVVGSGVASFLSHMKTGTSGRLGNPYFWADAGTGRCAKSSRGSVANKERILGEMRLEEYV